jgi:hypothetical protein
MRYTLRKDSSATQQQAYWCELSKENVKKETEKEHGEDNTQGSRNNGKDLKRSGKQPKKKPTGILSWRPNARPIGYRYFLHLT